jgi:hypothetical protein
MWITYGRAGIRTGITNNDTATFQSVFHALFVFESALDSDVARGN